jgi:hypothetical protein
MMQPATASGVSYASELTQSVTWHSALRELQGERTYRIGFTITTAAPAGDSIRATARVDSMRAVMDSPHGRQVIDTRRMVGNTFALTYAQRGGPANYSDVPVADFGMLGGAFPASTLIDYAFPAMPDHAVKTGDSWQHTWTRRQVDATSGTLAQITTLYTLLAFEKLDGAVVARVQVSSKGELSADTSAGAPAWEKPGSVQSNGYVLIGVDDGVVREVALEEAVKGFAAMGKPQTQYDQTAKIHVQRVSAK